MKKKYVKFSAILMIGVLVIYLSNLYLFSVQAATVGAVVNSPESGFTRYDDTANSNLFIYQNMKSWSNGDTTNFLNGNTHVPNNYSLNASVGFSFQGSQFYLFVQLASGRNSNIDIYIDGTIQTYSAPQYQSNGHIVCYVSPVLSNSFHTVLLVYNPEVSGELMFDGIDVKGTILNPSTTPTISEVVNSPISGFTRYDDTTNNSLFTYQNMKSWSNGDTTDFLNGNAHVPNNYSSDASVGFSFQGSQFYLFVQFSGGRNSNISIYIDGTIQTYTAPQYQTNGHVVCYVSPILSNSFHTVMLVYNQEVSGELMFDGIDVKGTILNPSTTPTVSAVANSPISGYNRYDDTSNSNLFTYQNMTQWSSGDTSDFLNGNTHRPTDTTKDATVSFKMQGTNFYLICQCYDDLGGRNKDIDVYIDGNFIQRFTAPQQQINGHIIYYASPIFSSGNHVVTLKYNKNDGYMFFDGIDVKGTIYIDTTAPSIPAHLICTSQSNRSAALSWDASTDTQSGVAGYKIYRNGQYIATSVSNSYIDTGLNRTTYTYTVTSYDKDGNESAKSSPLSISFSGGSFDSSIQILSNSTATDSIYSATDKIFYKVNESLENDFIEIKIVNPSENRRVLQYTVSIYDPNRGLITSQKCADQTEYIRCKVNSSGYYYITVNGDSNNYSVSSPFTLTVN